VREGIFSQGLIAMVMHSEGILTELEAELIEFAMVSTGLQYGEFQRWPKSKIWRWLIMADEKRLKEEERIQSAGKGR